MKKLWRNRPILIALLASALFLVLAAVSGYAVADPDENASHGGFKDWFIDTFARPGLTLELGLGQNPLPLRHFEAIYAKAREMLLLSVLL